VAEVAVDSLWSYAVAGYVLTAVMLVGYLGSLFARARRARVRAGAIAARRQGSGSGAA
jgi:hypothetical protein